MAAILFSVVSFLLQQIVLRALIFTFLLAAIIAITNYVGGLITTSDSSLTPAILLLNSWSTINVGNGATFDVGSLVRYFYGYFLVGQGIACVISAYCTRFFIRRIPFFN